MARDSLVPSIAISELSLPSLIDVTGMCIFLVVFCEQLIGNKSGKNGFIVISNVTFNMHHLWTPLPKGAYYQSLLMKNNFAVHFIFAFTTVQEQTVSSRKVGVPQFIILYFWWPSFLLNCLSARLALVPDTFSPFDQYCRRFAYTLLFLRLPLFTFSQLLLRGNPVWLSIPALPNSEACPHSLKQTATCPDVVIFLWWAVLP